MIVIDAATVISTYGPNNTPDPAVKVDPGMIDMVTVQNHAISGNGGGELNLSAQSEDIIQWRATTTSAPGGYDAVLYRFSESQGGIITWPVAISINTNIAVYNASSPNQPTLVPYTDVIWQSNVQNKGNLTYNFYFILTDQNGNVQGYYYWDPYIQINS